MIYLIESQSSSSVLFHMIIVPTDEESSHTIKQALVNQWHDPTVKLRSLVTVAYFPSWMYKTYGSFIDDLCTDAWIQYALTKYSQSDIDRHCNVNSPLHYLLVDTVLEYIKINFDSTFWMVITNADNYYIPQFFNHLIEWKDKDIDILMVNMIYKGSLFPTEFKREKTDLGSYAIKSNYLLKTNAAFLSSLPTRCNAKHFHDADGYFIEKLVSMKAKIMKVDQFVFAQN